MYVEETIYSYSLVSDTLNPRPQPPVSTLGVRTSRKEGKVERFGTVRKEELEERTDFSLTVLGRLALSKTRKGRRFG